MAAICTSERRRHAVRAHTDADGQPDLNGIDYLEVSEDQLHLRIFFLGQAPAITPANVRIDGGRQVIGIKALHIEACLQADEELDDCLVVVVDRPGDFSTYTLCLVEPDERGRPGRKPLAGFDERYACIEFSFKAGCPRDQDCATEEICPPEPAVRPEISYLARDYASFRQLILDRLALTMPGWTERHVPDLGITLVELLAYVGDHLSYYQEAVATEAYLDTARRRSSVRRHVRLVDYRVHEGCNARAFVHLRVSDDYTIQNPGALLFATRIDARLAELGEPLALEALAQATGPYELFAPLGQSGPLALYREHNEIALYTWGDAECCLPRGATAATLLDRWLDPAPTEPPVANPPPTLALGATLTEPAQPRRRALSLRPGDLLLLEEVRGPRTGDPDDADPRRRHVVRLTAVEPRIDALDDTPVVEVRWDAADALPFALCISATTAPPACCYHDRVSVARGNLLLVDHGRPAQEDLGTPPVVVEHGLCRASGEPGDPIYRAGPFHPTLQHTPLTRSTAFPGRAALSRAQAGMLRTVPGRVQARLAELLEIAAGGQLLGPVEIQELRPIFGQKALEKYEIVPPSRRPVTAKKQAEGLTRMYAELDLQLQSKLRWVEGLAARADAGYLVGSDDIAELGRLLGPRYTAGLAPDEPALHGPAAHALAQDVREALPALTLLEPPGRDGQPGAAWNPTHDLLESTASDRHVVVEREEDGTSRLRFGDGSLGCAPEPGVALLARYRVGNGAAGNVGAETIVHAIFRDDRPQGITIHPRNPLPASGGVEPEPLAEVRLLAPETFRSELVRAVTGEDYARLAERHPAVQRAAAELRWSGGWYTAHVAIDPRGDREADPALLEEVRRSLYAYRRIGHDLVVAPARYVALDIAMTICMLPGYQRGHVRTALLNLFSSRMLSDGRRGLFHPDNLSFGTAIHLSRLVAAARTVEGVETVQITTFQRLYEPAAGELDAGLIAPGPLEIARLDNSPNAPDRGRLTLTMRGGR